MNRQRIQFLSRLIPPGAPYGARIPREGIALGLPDQVDLYARAAHDPRVAEPRDPDRDSGVHPEPVDASLAKSEVPLLCAA